MEITAKKEQKGSWSRTELRLIRRRLGNAVITLLVIAYLALLGLLLAERGREHLPAGPLNAMWQSAAKLMDYLFHHPATYIWNRQTIPAFELVSRVLSRSAALLVVSMLVALFLGVLLGVNAALSKRKFLSSIVLSISILGISTPSFLLAMLFWILNIKVHNIFDIKVLPSAGFGWDAHMVMPALVLAMRPLAQIAQITYISLNDILKQDYIRTAQAKGLSWRVIRNRHALRNILIPILTTLGTSLRFSLASLPIVELFFEWPGVGSTLFDAINQRAIYLVVDLLLSLGLFFLLVNLVLEILFPLLDARITDATREAELQEEGSFGSWWIRILETVQLLWKDLVSGRGARRGELPQLPAREGVEKSTEEPVARRSTWRWTLKNILSNPSLILGSILVIGLTGLLLFGHKFTSANPYQTNDVMMIDGKIHSAPYKPSATFPWGSDYIGRDIQALVLFGAKQTLTLAFFGMLARLLVGTFLGALAGWQQKGWLDRLVTSAIGVWAAFPVTLFAMILIQALGIQQGMWVFIVAVCIVGWGEIAQFVRSQVITIKPQLYVESARSAGLRSDQIMTRHVVPNLVNGFVALAALEMGGVLMLLAELGYLNIFLGGGFQAVIGEAGHMQPVVVNYSDVPEWASMIANIRQWWRSYPWMVTYPGIAFFISIIAFNLTGEGLRRFLDEAQVNLSRLFNRYTFGAMIAGVIVLDLIIRSSSPMTVYRPEALKFNTENVQRDIQALTALNMHGRETGMPGADKAADYIAQRMKEVGLIPAGEHGTYLQKQVSPRLHLWQIPTLSLLGADENAQTAYGYRKDFVEVVGNSFYGDCEGTMIGVVFGPRVDMGKAGDPYNIFATDALDRVAIVRAADLQNVNRSAVCGILAIADDSSVLQRKNLYPNQSASFESQKNVPVMYITPQLANTLLATAGSSLADLESIAAKLDANAVGVTKPGGTMHLSILPSEAEDLTSESYINVLGVYPGEAVLQGMDSQVIMISAYYDGLGTGPDGTLYPGANDNASGVATMLEMARLLKQSAYKPDKTVLFVAWAGGERGERLSVTSIMNARPGGSDLNVEEVMELSGLGYGKENSLAIGEESSYRMVKLFQSAAHAVGVSTTTRGRSPHYGQTITYQFGDRTALTLSLSWDGSDDLAHTPADIPDIIDPQKLYKSGSAASLTMFYLSRETDY